MVRSNFGAVRLPLLGAAVLASFAASLSAQVVEKGRTLADLIASHPCDTGLTNRIARVTDCDSATDFGDGGGAFNCWAYCDGSAPWTNLSIGGGSGGGLSDSDYGDVAVSGSGTAMTVEALRGGAVAVAATTGNLQWEGTTADAFEGNFTFADPTADWTWAWGAAGDLVGAGSLSIDNLKLDGNTISSTDTNGNIVLAPNGTGQITVPNGLETKPAIALAESATKGISFSQNGQGNFAWVDSNQVRLFIGSQETRTQADNFYGWTSSTSEGGGATTNDTALGRSAAGIVAVNGGDAATGGALHYTLLASPPRTCDATAEGDTYSDTSHALCWCDGSAWQKLSGAGTCA